MTDEQFNKIIQKLEQIITLLKPKPPVTVDERRERIRKKLEEDRERRGDTEKVK